MNAIDITFLDIMSQSMIIVMIFFIEDMYTKAIAYRVDFHGDMLKNKILPRTRRVIIIGRVLSIVYFVSMALLPDSAYVLMVPFITYSYIIYRVWTTKEEVKVYDGRRW